LACKQAAGVIQIAQPISVRERLGAGGGAAGRRALLIVLLPVMVVFVAWIVGRRL
jgi:hypothetical protein